MPSRHITPRRCSRPSAPPHWTLSERDESVYGHFQVWGFDSDNWVLTTHLDPLTRPRPPSIHQALPSATRFKSRRGTCARRRRGTGDPGRGSGSRSRSGRHGGKPGWRAQAGVATRRIAAQRAMRHNNPADTSLLVSPLLYPDSGPSTSLARPIAPPGPRGPACTPQVPASSMPTRASVRASRVGHHGPAGRCDATDALDALTSRSSPRTHIVAATNTRAIAAISLERLRLSLHHASTSTSASTSASTTASTSASTTTSCPRVSTLAVSTWPAIDLSSPFLTHHFSAVPGSSERPTC